MENRGIGFFAASQGAWVTALAANRVEAPDFLIMVSASLSTVAEDRIFGREAQLRHAGFDEQSVAEAVELIRLDHAVTRTPARFEELQLAWNRFRDRPWFTTAYDSDTPEPADSPYRAWERRILDFDPVPLLERLSTPTLWIFGDPRLDRFAPVSLSLQRIEGGTRSGVLL